MPLRRIFSINLITHLTYNIQYKAGNHLYDALIDPRETIIISMRDIHEDTVESRYNGSKSNGNPPKTDAVFQSPVSFSLFLIAAIAEICLDWIDIDGPLRSVMAGCNCIMRILKIAT